MDILKYGASDISLNILNVVKTPKPLRYVPSPSNKKRIWRFFSNAPGHQGIQYMNTWTSEAKVFLESWKSSIPGARKPPVVNGCLVKQLNFPCKDFETPSKKLPKKRLAKSEIQVALVCTQQSGQTPTLFASFVLVVRIRCGGKHIAAGYRPLRRWRQRHVWKVSKRHGLGGWLKPNL